MLRKLATIQRVERITPIAKADRIELIHIKGWQVVSQKGLHAEGDFVVFFEIDSFFKEGSLPYAPDLEPRGIKKSQLDTGEVISGYLIKSIKLRGEISQGYIVPFSSYTREQQIYFKKHLENDYDLTSFLNVYKFEKPETGSEREQRLRENRPPKGRFNKFKWLVTRWLENKFPKIFKKLKFKTQFPSFIPKTACVRIQNYKEEMWQHYQDNILFQVSYKLDGSSITIYKKDKVKGVCSRNLALNPKVITNKFNVNGFVIQNKLKEYPANYCIQGELVSPSIQGNFEGVSQEEVYVYSIWDIDAQVYLNPLDALLFCRKYDLKHVPILHEAISLPTLFPNVVDSDDLLNKLLAYADGPSGLKGKYREGLVYKQCSDGFTAIKTISNSYLIKSTD